LVPIPLSGNLYLTGTGLANITVTVHFPPPFGVNLVGAQNLTTNTLTFSTAAGGLDIPDIPLSSLHTHFSGGSLALFTTSCATPNASITSSFTAQNGKTASPSAPFTVAGCATKPTASNTSLGGLGKKKPKLKFKLSAGTGGPNSLKSFKVGLPKGLSFKSSKIKKGLKVSGGKVFSAKVSGGKLVVVLKGTTTTSVTVTVKSPALKVSNALAKKAKKHKDKTVLGASTTLTLTFKKPS
jgi:hypothetical protein